MDTCANGKILWHNHRIVERFGLEGTLQITQSHSPAMDRDPFHQPRLLQAPSNPALSTAREGAATTSLGNLGQGLTTLIIKDFFLIPNLNLPTFSLKPSPLVLSQPLSSSPAAPPGTGSCSKVSPQPSLLQAEQPQLSQPFLPAEGFQPSCHCWGLLWPRSDRSTSNSS